MLLYNDVQWQWTGEPRTGASSGIGTVRIDSRRVLVYESASDAELSYVLNCAGVEGTVPLHQSISLLPYTLVFTRPPIFEADVPSPYHSLGPSAPLHDPSPPPSAATPSTAAAPSTAAGPSSAAGPSCAAGPSSAAGPSLQSTVPAKRKATAFSPTCPPTSPLRSAAAKSSHPPTCTSTAGSVAAQPEATKRRRLALSPDETPVASTSKAPAASSSKAPVASSSKASVASTSKQLAPKKQEKPYVTTMAVWKQEWLDDAEARHARESKLLKSAVTATKTNATIEDELEHRLFELVNGRIGERTRYGPALGPDSPARQHIAAHPDTIRTLERLATQPFLPPQLDDPALRRVAYDPFASEADGGMLKPTEDDADGLGPEDAAAQFYLRSLIFPNVDALHDFLAIYEAKFGDACWTAATRRSLELAKLEQDSAVSLQYAGMTIRATPGGRVLADLQAADGYSRCCNILKLARKLKEEQLGSRHGRTTRAAAEGEPESPTTAGSSESSPTSLQLVVHEFVELRLAASKATDANRPLVGDTEVALIASIKPAAFNSADGGRLLRIDPSALSDLAGRVSDLDATRSALDALAPLDPILAEKDELYGQIKRALDDSISYYQIYEPEKAGLVLDRTTKGGRRAYDDILANVSALRTRSKGQGFRSFEFLLAKDITASALRGDETFSTGDAPARGPAAGYLLDRIVQDAQTSEQGWRSLTPSADFWAVILKHYLHLLALLFGARVLNLASPLLIVSHSGIISVYLRQNLFRDAFDTASPDLDAFLNAERTTDPALVESIRSGMFDLPDDEDDERTQGWILGVGSTAIVRYGPHGRHVALHVAQLHPGFVKYNPLVQDEAVALFAAAAAKTALSRRVLAAHLVENHGVVPEEANARLAFFRKVRQCVEQEALECGLEKDLAKTRRTLADRYGALHSERKLAGSQRRLEADAEDEAERRSTAAKKAVANRSERPSFVGNPLTKADFAALDSHFADDRLRFADLPDQLIRTSPRLAALQALLVADAEASMDGLISTAPEVAVGPVGSRNWCEWYLSAAEGVELARSAAQAGNGKLRTWSEDVRDAYVRMCRAREALKRQARGIELRGQLKLVDVLRRLREDRSPGGKGTAGGGSRRDIFISTCRQCQQVYLDAHYTLKQDSHACGTDTFTRIPVLFSSTVALLLGESLLALEAEGLPAYKEVKARSLVPDSMLAVLPFDATLNATIHIPLGTRPEFLVPLAVDALLVASRNNFSIKSPSERILSIGGQRDAWSGNFEKSLYHIFRGILRNVELTTDVCPICLKLRFVASDTRFEQHTCAPAKIERNGRSVPNQVLYQEENRSSVPQGESLLILGPEPFRRILYAMTDSRDKALSAFILGAAADAKRAGDAGVKEFLAETKTHDELKRMAAFAQRVLGWRQP